MRKGEDLARGRVSNETAFASIEVAMGEDPIVVNFTGNAMEPTFPSGTQMMCRQFDATFSGPLFVKDVIAFTNPLNKDQILVRRVGAVAQDEIVSSDPDDVPFTLDEDSVWVMSDNPTNMLDSRAFGPVSVSQLAFGRVVMSRPLAPETLATSDTVTAAQAGSVAATAQEEVAESSHTLELNPGESKGEGGGKNEQHQEQAEAPLFMEINNSTEATAADAVFVDVYRHDLEAL